MSLKLVFPMGGTGQRFKEAGYGMPKPLLEVKGKRLLQWALTSVSQLQGSYEFLITADLASHVELVGITPEGCWHTLTNATSGPLATVLTAKNCLATDDELLLCDCDSFLDPYELKDALAVFRETKANGGITVRQTKDPNCAFADLGAEWWVSSTREKDPYTQWSATGPYWFKTGHLFIKAAEQAARASLISIAPVYNFLPKTKAVPISTFHHLGTPEEFEAFRHNQP